MPPPAKKKRKTNAGAAATVTRRTTRSQKPLLSIEMIGKVGSFADYDNGDLMNICLAIGPAGAKIVRHACLFNNTQYLRRLTEKNLPSLELKSAKEELSSWMEVNTHWRGVICSEELVNSGGYCVAKIEEGGRNRMHMNPLFLFNNPAVAIELEMLDILKYQVEEVGIDVNACRWSGYTSVDQFHLLVMASVVDDKACFDFLLSCKALDVRAPAEAADNLMLWQHALMTKRFSVISYQCLVRHPSFAPNRSFVDDDGDEVLPLQFACLACIAIRDAEDQRQMVAKVKCLLDAGADPLLATASIPSSIEYAASLQDTVKRDVNGVDLKRVQLCQELIDMMEEKISAEK